MKLESLDYKNDTTNDKITYLLQENKMLKFEIRDLQESIESLYDRINVIENDLKNESEY